MLVSAGRGEKTQKNPPLRLPWQSAAEPKFSNGPTGRFAVKSLAELVGKVASLYDTQERVRRSEEECGLTTNPEPTQSAQGTTTMHSRRHQRAIFRFAAGS